MYCLGTGVNGNIASAMNPCLTLESTFDENLFLFLAFLFGWMGSCSKYETSITKYVETFFC